MNYNKEIIEKTILNNFTGTLNQKILNFSREMDYIELERFFENPIDDFFLQEVKINNLTQYKVADREEEDEISGSLEVSILLVGYDYPDDDSHDSIIIKGNAEISVIIDFVYYQKDSIPKDFKVIEFYL